mgnify:CR=1 FL=1
MISKRAKAACNFFTKDRADDYEPRAKSRGLWELERVELEAIIDSLPYGLKVLDIPVGTGRLLSAFDRRGFDVLGLDASPYMVARAKALNTGARLDVASIFELPAEDQSFDVTFCIRLFHLIEHSDFVIALEELKRVTKQKIVLTVRFGNDDSPCRGPERLNLFMANLYGWRIVRETRGHGDWYLFVLDRC